MVSVRLEYSQWVTFTRDKRSLVSHRAIHIPWPRSQHMEPGTPSGHACLLHHAPAHFRERMKGMAGSLDLPCLR